MNNSFTIVFKNKVIPNVTKSNIEIPETDLDYYLCLCKSLIETDIYQKTFISLFDWFYELSEDYIQMEENKRDSHLFYNIITQIKDFIDGKYNLYSLTENIELLESSIKTSENIKKVQSIN